MRRVLSVLALCMIIVGAGVFVLGVLFLEEAPRAAAMPAPSPQDVLGTRKFVKQVRESTEAVEDSGNLVAIPLHELNGVIRLGGRFLPGLRAAATIEGDAVVAQASLPLPWLTGTRWLNIEASVPAFDDRIALREVTAGGMALPPEAALQIGRIGANLILGRRSGDTILNSASAMQVQGDVLVFTLRIDSAQRGDVLESVFSSLRGADMPGADDVDRYYILIREAIDAGVLPTEGSFLPYVTFTLHAALDAGRQSSLPDAYTAALLALAKACGAKDFTLIVGRLVDGPANDFGTWNRDCTRTTLAERVDTRRHFVTAAAIKAASNRGFAISIGEFKELNDMGSGSGFDFTDVAANNSGIRMSDLMMSQSPETWPALIARIGTEGDIVAAFDGIPGVLPKEEFKRRFGEIDSPEYGRMLDLIEARIDRLALHERAP